MDLTNRPILNPQMLLAALDAKLEKAGIQLDLVIRGGFVLQMQYDTTATGRPETSIP